MNEQTIQPVLPGILEPLVQPKVSKEATIQEKFEAFHQANPHVYQALRRMALQMRRNGIKHFGMKALFELLRFDYAMQTGGKPYKLCNSFTSRYARLLVQNEPILEGFFELRALREAGCDE